MENLFRENSHHHEAIEKESPENEATANRTFYLPPIPLFEEEEEKDEEEDEANDDSKVIADGPTAEQTTFTTTQFLLLLLPLPPPPPITKKCSTRQIPLVYCYGALFDNHHHLQHLIQ